MHVPVYEISGCGTMEIGEQKIRDHRGRLNGMAVKVLFTYNAPKDLLCAHLDARDRTGAPIYDGKLCLPLGPLRARVHEALTRWHAEQHGGKVQGWGDLVKAARKISEKVGAKKLLQRANTILKDPRFAKGAALASTIYPPLGITYGAVRTAAYLVEEAQKGQQDAKIKLAGISMLARLALEKADQGVSLTPEDLKAVRSARALSALWNARKDGIDVKGWAWNLPYREPVTWAAQTLIDPSPGIKVRAGYARAISRIMER